MKKLISILAVSILLLSFASCSEKSSRSLIDSNSSTNYADTQLSKEYSDQYVSIKYSPAWTKLDNGANGPAYTISGDAKVYVYYSLFEKDKIDNETFIRNNISSGSSVNDNSYVNKNNVAFLKIIRDDVKMFLHASKDYVVHVEFYNCSDDYNHMIDNFLDNITILSPDIPPSVDTTTTQHTMSAHSVSTATASVPSNDGSSVSASQKNALKSANSYIKYNGFSRDGLIEQLEYEQFSHEDAVYGADNCGADWNAEAIESAKSFIKLSGFSYTGLIEQLEYQKFTADQARYGADNCGADWNQQAADSAASYLKSFDFSRDELIDQLLYEGFTQEQAEYGASAIGY